MRDRFEPVRDLIGDRSVSEAHALALKALRQWYAERRPERRVTLHGDLGLGVLTLLAQEKGVASRFDAIAGKEAFLELQREAFMRPFIEFTWWLVRVGAATPGEQDVGRLISVYLTEAGERLLAQDEEHPLLPGYVRRLYGRCRGLPTEVLTYLGDAHDCYEHGLLRPAVILAGLSYEVAVEWVFQVLASRGHELKADKAGDRIAKLKARRELLGQRDEHRRLATAALDFADHLRVRRNDGAHGIGHGFNDATEVEELLISTGRHLEILYRLAQMPEAASK